MISKNFSRLALAGTAALFLHAAPAAAHDTDGLHINGFSFESTEDLLDRLIDLDADDIDALRTDLSEARADVFDAIKDVEEARDEAADIPGGGFIYRIAIKIASRAVKDSTHEAFQEVSERLFDVEEELDQRRPEIGEAEYAETNTAISVIRTGIADIELAIDELLAAMRKTA